MSIASRRSAAAAALGAAPGPPQPPASSAASNSSLAGTSIRSSTIIRPMECPYPRPSKAPTRRARPILPPVSSHMPNCPLLTYSSTSSQVRPRKANSQSWMEPAPLVAMCCSQPSSTILPRSGANPFLITWAPWHSTTGAPLCLASIIRSAARSITDAASPGSGAGASGSTATSLISSLLRLEFTGRNSSLDRSNPSLCNWPPILSTPGTPRSPQDQPTGDSGGMQGCSENCSWRKRPTTLAAPAWWAYWRCRHLTKSHSLIPPMPVFL